MAQKRTTYKPRVETIETARRTAYREPGSNEFPLGGWYSSEPVRTRLLESALHVFAINGWLGRESNQPGQPPSVEGGMDGTNGNPDFRPYAMPHVYRYLSSNAEAGYATGAENLGEAVGTLAVMLRGWGFSREHAEKFMQLLITAMVRRAWVAQADDEVAAMLWRSVLQRQDAVLIKQESKIEGSPATRLGLPGALGLAARIAHDVIQPVAGGAVDRILRGAVKDPERVAQDAATGAAIGALTPIPGATAAGAALGGGYGAYKAGDPNPPTGSSGLPQP